MVVKILRASGLEVYDFKEPTTCFKWEEVANVDEHGGGITAAEYLEALAHPRAYAGFDQDMSHLQAASTVVLILPAGNSAHLELGYAVGQGKSTAILLDDPVKDMDLMHLACENFFTQIDRLVRWCREQEASWLNQILSLSPNDRTRKALDDQI